MKYSNLAFIWLNYISFCLCYIYEPMAVHNYRFSYFKNQVKEYCGLNLEFNQHYGYICTFTGESIDIEFDNEDNGKLEKSDDKNNINSNNYHNSSISNKNKGNIKKNNDKLKCKIPSNLTISVFDDFPFKRSLYQLLNELSFVDQQKNENFNTNNEDDDINNESISNNESFYLENNFINDFLLSLRLLFETKVNHTETFIQYKLMENSNYTNNFKMDNSTNDNDFGFNFSSDLDFKSYKEYLRNFNNKKEYKKYLSMIPFQYSYSQAAFYKGGDNDYMKSGHSKPSTQLIERVFLTIAELVNTTYNYTNLKKEEYNNNHVNDKYYKYIPVFRIIKNWLNSQNINMFRSIFAFVNSKNLKHRLSEYINNNLSIILQNENLENQNQSFKDNNKSNISNDINKYIDEKSKFGVSYILPGISYCRSYIDSNKFNITSTFLVKEKIKNSAENNLNTYELTSSKSYKIGKEVLFVNSEKKDNDYLLLNLGISPKNNIFHKFSFHFELEDPYKSLYNYLYKKKFNMESIKLKKNNNTESIVLDFKLSKNEVNDDFFTFIELYLGYKKLLDKETKSNVDYYKFKNLEKILLVYYESMVKNIKNIFDSKLSFRSNDTISLIYEIQDNIKEIRELENNLTQFNVNNALNNQNNDDKDHKESIGRMDYLIKFNNIQNFHLENLKILNGNNKLILDQLINLQGSALFNTKLKGSIKRKYVNK